MTPEEIARKALDQAIAVCLEQERAYRDSDSAVEQRIGARACRKCAAVIRALIEDHFDDE